MRRKLQKNSIYKHKIDNHINNIINSSNDFCILANNVGILTQKQLECIRILINRRIKKLGGKFIIKIKPQTPITKKSLGVRMGKGKGSFKEMIFVTKKNQLLFEFKNISYDLFIQLFNKIKYKLPIKIKIFNKTSFYNNLKI